MATNNDGRLEFKATLDDADVVKKIKNLKGDFKDIGNTTEKVTKQQTTAFNTLGKSVSSLGNIIKSVFAGFGILAGFQAIFSLIRTGVRDIIQFDKAMVNMAAIAGKTRSELRGVESEIRKVASESLNSATAVADMATELIKLGTTPEGVKALLKPVNDLSIASQMSADATAVLLKGTLNAFQASEKEATRYADVMANALNKTALDAQKFADSFTYIASTANVAGYSIEETSAMIGVLVDNNVQASSAGRVLSSVFGRLAKGGKELEGELEKIRNSQDKLAQASKIFGAEGARLGVILSNNKDRLAELTREFENSSGSLAELTNKQLESFSAKLNILTSAWQEFVLSLENGQGVLAKVLRGALDIITDLIGGMTVLAKSQSELREIRGSSLGSQELQYINDATDAYIKQRQKRFDANNEIYTAEKKAFEEKEMREKLFEERQTKHGQNLIKLRQEEAQINAKQARNRFDFDRLKQIQSEIEIAEASYNAISQAKNEILAPAEITVEDTKKESATLELTKERLNLLRQINNVERELNDDVLSGRELALLKVERKYEDLIAKAKELGMTDAKIRQLQAKETAIVSYKADTDALKANLEQQKALHDEFEQYKLKVGTDQANEMYKNLIDTSKSYYDLIGEELDKIDVTDMTAKERDRYAVLTNMLIEYGHNQDKAERERLANLYTNTLSTEQKIFEIRSKYAKMYADLTNQYEGIELELRTKELDKQLKDEFSTLSNEITQQAEKYSDVANLVAGATRNQIEAQIRSLENYLNTASGLTKDQVDNIQTMIDNLSLALPTALGDSGEGATKAVQREFNQLESEIKKLTGKIKLHTNEAGEVLEGFEDIVANLNAQIAGLRSRQDDLKFEGLIASGKDIESLGNEFLNLANNIGGAFGMLGGLLGALGQITQISGSVITSVGNIGKAFKDIKEQGGLGGIFSASGVGGVASAVLPIVSAVSALGGIIGGISRKQKEEYSRFKQWQSEVYRGELEYQALLRRRSFEGIDKGLPTADLLKAQMDELKSQMPEVEREFADQLDRLQREGSFIIDRYRRKKWGFSKTKTTWGDLVGVDFEEMERLFLEGKLEGETRVWFEELRKVKEEMDAIGLSFDDLANQMAELMTGTNWQELSSTFANMFASGTNSAIEFGNTLEEVIKGAIVAGFKANFIDKEMQNLFDKLAEYSQDGELTQSEIDSFTNDAMNRLEYLNNIWNSLTENLDINFGEDEIGVGGFKDSVKRITESQADRLVGLMNGLQIATNIQTDELRRLTITAVAFNEYGKQSLAYLNAIQTNTLRTANNTDALGEINSNIRNLANNQVEQNRAYGIQ